MHSASAAPAPSPRPTIVLVHGAWETAAIWRPLAGRLRRNGYRVIAVNLPGRPGAALGPEKASLSAYRDAMMQAMEQERAPVVLVGHSFGGITITNVAEAVPDKVKTLVYLAAFVPEPGQSLLDVSKRDTGSRLASQLSVDQARGTVSIKPEARGPIMANDGTVAQQAELASMLVDEPLQPMATPVQWSAARAGKVDRVYLRTRLDQAVSPAFQSEMASNTPMRMTIDLETGHAPFVTMPDQLASAIEHILQ
ncbi:alpha/beta fold hydrolase [Xanthomonas citri]|uniref:Alpha/beta hydrolase n=2 Tax=Xanthomonas citri TaxID=346 RepID=A0AB33CUQ0_XANCI|nr:alpha/beta fold hydrolase [Xanthomonas citri]ASK94466.1 alpha/beta hydrolase [Xanthomonas citri pv. vignicola]